MNNAQQPNRSAQNVSMEQFKKNRPYGYVSDDDIPNSVIVHGLRSAHGGHLSHPAKKRRVSNPEIDQDWAGRSEAAPLQGNPVLKKSKEQKAAAGQSKTTKGADGPVTPTKAPVYRDASTQTPSHGTTQFFIDAGIVQTAVTFPTSPPPSPTPAPQQQPQQPQQ